MNKIELRYRRTKKVFFSHTAIDNTIKKTVEEALRQGFSLYELELSGTDLRGVDFRNAPMAVRNCNFTGANLEGANFSGLTIIDCVFFMTNLRNADLSNATFSGCCTLMGAFLDGAISKGITIFCRC